jgi:FkbM family methyltransferase
MKKLIRSLINSMGYDVIPFPLNEWSEQRLTLGRHLIELFSRYHVNCVFDVGAHYGEYGSFLRDVGYAGRIVSFEPVQGNFERLRQRSLSDPQWEVHRLALGSENTEMDIKVFRDTDLSSFLTPNDYCASHMGRKDLVEHTERVEIQTLDTVFDRCVQGLEEPYVFLKLDTQGYDLRVLAQASGHMDRIRGLQSELSVKPIYDEMPSYLEALPKMKEMGFEVTGLFPVSRDRKSRLIEVDCVMIRDNTPALETRDDFSAVVAASGEKTSSRPQVEG